MTENSAICKFIQEHPYDWETILNGEYKINTYWDDRFPNLCIFKYKIDATFDNDIAKEARGIIINVKTQDVVCRPFDKFFEYDNPNAVEIDWTSAMALEKIDGTMISLWYYEPEDRWVTATQRFISADDILCRPSGGAPGETFHDLFMSAIPDCDFRYLDKEATYVFELTSPKNQVVIKYNETNIWYLVSRNNQTGQECIFRKGINMHEDIMKYARRPAGIRAETQTLNEYIRIVSSLNKESNGEIKHIEHEGFVIMDRNYNRIKVKSLEWLALHNAFNNGLFNKNRIVPLLLNTKFNIDSICNDMPEYASFLRYYQFKVVELKRNMNMAIKAAMKVYKVFDGNMSILGPAFSKTKYATAIFLAIKREDRNTTTADDIIPYLAKNYILSLIEEYKPEKVVEEIYDALRK